MARSTRKGRTFSTEQQAAPGPLAARAVVRLESGEGSQSRLVTVIDRGIGIEPDCLEKTILSLHGDNKISSRFSRAAIYGRSLPYMRKSCKFRSNWCGRWDSNPHGETPSDFKSDMSTIPSRPQPAPRQNSFRGLFGTQDNALGHNASLRLRFTAQTPGFQVPCVHQFRQAGTRSCYAGAARTATVSARTSFGGMLRVDQAEQ